MATPNYKFAKRQRDLAKKKKREEKLAKKQAAAKSATDGDLPPAADGSEAQADTQALADTPAPTEQSDPATPQE